VADVPTEDLTAYHAYLQAKEILDVSRFDASSWFLCAGLLEKAVERDPTFFEAWVELTRTYAGLCHFDWDRTEARLAQAKAAADRAFGLRPDAALAYFARGLYYYWGLKDYEKALAAFRQADRIRPEDPRILEAMAYVLRRQEAYAEAADILLGVAELSPRDPALCVHVAETLGIVGRYEEADRWASKAIELGPGQPMNYTFAAWIAVQAGWPERARGYLAELPPSTDPEIRWQAYRIRYELRDYAAALREAGALPDIHESQYAVVSRDLARAMIHLALDRSELAGQEFARAEAALREKLREKPAAGNLVAARAVALAGMGRGEEGLAEIGRSLDLFPASKDAWIRTWRLYDRALIQVLAGRPEEAVSTLTDLMSRQTDVVSPSILANSPQFDGLRGRDDFQALLAGLS
jgi:serine/threonine-protein kinase